MRSIVFVILLLASCSTIYAQQMSGSLETRANFFDRDTTIGAANTPQYDRQLYGAEAWLNLGYSNWGFDFQLRFDLFNNSNLRNPNGSFTARGIGFYQIRKKINKLDITGGYLYDQIGSGIIFRAYEQRAQLIDNALFGVRLGYDISDNWQIKAFTGQQKQLFSQYESIIKGIALDGFVKPNKEKNLSFAPGIGIVNRTFDDNTMRSVIASLETYDTANVFIPKYNTYAFSVYNRLTAGNISWYAEVALKTDDVQNDPIQERFIGEDGAVYYSSLSYSRKGFALTLEGKRTEAFDFRTRPQEIFNFGQLHFIPPMARENSYRLTTRYQPATQFIGEQAYQANLRFTPFKKFNVEANYSDIKDLDNLLLYREIYLQSTYKYKRLWTLTTGIQLQDYNQEIFETKPGVPIVKTVVPFAEFQYKFDRKKSIKLEVQYMDTDEDFGSWVFALAEFAVAPKWSFEISDMYNLGLDKPSTKVGLNKHYPTVGVAYSKLANRFSLRYVRQVEGIICSGGICRLEPAFSGVRFTATSTF